MASGHSWEASPLWAELASRAKDDPNLVPGVARLLSRIELVLAGAGTSPPSFTLHDGEHSRRVAERAAFVTPSEVLAKFSKSELALLLLAAYAHDIGMTPARGLVRAHYEYLLSGNVGKLTEREIESFQTWLDREAQGVDPPLQTGQNTTESLRYASELVAQYSRDQHVAWGEEWIRENISENDVPLYQGWLSDLIALCRSHHEGIAELASARFDAAKMANGDVVNLRYLAAVLRVSDVLELDPERTPSLIYRHRDIPPHSAIYWHKDHHIRVERQNQHLVLTSRPPSAYIHRAVELTAAQIDHELQMCRTLADERKFSVAPGFLADLPHYWDLPSALHRVIVPREDSYEYIDGAFRPDTERLMELLSGTELYQTRFAAIRELLQNAFDAVRDQIAWTRLAQADAQDSERLRALRETHKVSLSFETTTEGLDLVCTDTGTGMTKQIIRDHFLVSGSAPRTDILRLLRLARSAGFDVGRTGRFGIGVLSYFMLASRVTLRTRRSTEPGDGEDTGWKFETEGIGSFGELRRDPIVSHGTEVRLHLRRDVVGDSPDEWLASLGHYVDRALRWLPSAFEFTGSAGETLVTARPAWRTSTEDFAKRIAAGVQQQLWDVHSERRGSLRSRAELERQHAEEEYWSTAKDEITNTVRWIAEEGSLPDGLGIYRIHLPFFATKRGTCLAFLRIREDGIMEPLGTGDGYIPNGATFSSWRGIEVSSGPRREQSGRQWTLSVPSDAEDALRRRAMVEIDWRAVEAGRINVARDYFERSEAAEKALMWLSERVDHLLAAYLRNETDSPLSLLSARVAQSDLPPVSPLRWVHAVKHEGQRRMWADVEFPTMSAPSFAYLHKNAGELSLTLGEKPVSVLPCFRAPSDDDDYDGLSWNASNWAPDRIVFIPHYRPRLAPLWARDPRGSAAAQAIGLTSAFPDEWSDTVVGITFEMYAGVNRPQNVFNGAHPLIGQIDGEAASWCRTTFANDINPLPHRSEILRTRGRAAAWLALCISTGQRDAWNALLEEETLFVEDVFRTVDPSEPTTFAWIVERSTSPFIRLVTKNSWKTVGYEGGLSNVLPTVADEWHVQRDRKSFGIVHLMHGCRPMP